jgi:hypothetical protein
MLRGMVTFCRLNVSLSIVFINGRAKPNPSVDDVVAECRIAVR